MKLAYEYYEVNKQNKNHLYSAFYLSTQNSSYNPIPRYIVIVIHNFNNLACKYNVSQDDDHFYQMLDKQRHYS